MLVFFVILILIIFLIYISGINIQIDNLEIEKKEKMKIKKFKINIYLLLLNKLKILKVSIKKEKIDFNKILNRFQGKSLKKDTNNIIKNLKNLEIDVKKIKINAKIGLSDAIFLAYLVAILNIFFSIVYAKFAKNYNENYRYIIKPYQTNKFNIKISINCIFNVKIANIINMIIKNRSEVKNERTSNRIVNGNSYG